LSVSRKRVLVGDADEIVLALILHILQRQGYAVDVTTEAAELTRRLRAGRYDAVLVDPAVSPGGAQWIRDLVAAMPELRNRLIVAGSAAGCELPVRATLRKPLEFGLLIDTVHDCAEQ
jgi:CheY-like chemotaxis protein